MQTLFFKWLLERHEEAQDHLHSWVPLAPLCNCIKPPDPMECTGSKRECWLCCGYFLRGPVSQRRVGVWVSASVSCSVSGQTTVNTTTKFVVSKFLFATVHWWPHLWAPPLKLHTLKPGSGIPVRTGKSHRYSLQRLRR